MAEESLATIRNTGADRLRVSALELAVVLAAAVAAAAAAALLLAGEIWPVRAGVAAIPALAAVFCIGLLAQAVLEYLAAPSSIEYSAIIMMVRYRNGRFIGLSWAEISSVLPVGKRIGLWGGMLYDLKLSVVLKKDEVARNLSLKTAHMFVAAYQQCAKKLSADEAQRLADGMFGIKRY